MSTPYPAILSQFATDHLEEFEHAIETLKASFSRSFNGFSNPLPSLLGLDKATTGRISIPILDQNLQKHAEGVTSPSLLNLLEMTLTSAGFDQFETTKIILNELARRKDEPAQQQAVQIILASCQNYNAGMVFFETLLSDYVSHFEALALYDLLVAMPAHIMAQGTGDAADLLFIPAFKNAQKEALQNQLVELFFTYREGSVYYTGEEYFDDLLSEIKANVSVSLQEKLEAENAKRKEAALVRPSEEEMLQIINIVENEVSKASQQFHDIVVSQIEAIDLNDYVVEHTFDHFIATGQYDREIGAFLFNLWHEKSANKAGIYVNQLINSEKSDTVVGNTMIHDFYNIMSGQMPF